MIFGWLEHGVTGRWILVDPVFPWPALHNGRNALRAWADRQNRLRAIEHTPGPRRMPWPCRTAVKETGSADLRIWPVEIFGQPRQWNGTDHVWRDALHELAQAIAATIACPVGVSWPGGGPVDYAPRTVKSLEDQHGFIGWGKGEREPKLPAMDHAAAGNLKTSIGGADVRPLPQGETSWR
jgi:hypothetical protein